MQQERSLCSHVQNRDRCEISWSWRWQHTWRCHRRISSHSVNFRIDTGAAVTVVPDRFFKNSPLIQKTDRKLFGPGQNKISVIGSVHGTLAIGETSSEQELYVVGDLNEPLFGSPATETLKLTERVNSVDKDNVYKQEFPEHFTGLGRMKNVYTIRLQENAQPWAISTPRRPSLPTKEKVQEELKKLEEQDLIRSVETPTDWWAPIVAVPKPKWESATVHRFHKAQWECASRELSTTYNSSTTGPTGWCHNVHQTGL